jgi:hypothetical protein
MFQRIYCSACRVGMTRIFLVLAVLVGLIMLTSRSKAGDYTDITGHNLQIKINWWDARDPNNPPKLQDDDAPDDLLSLYAMVLTGRNNSGSSQVFDQLWSSQQDNVKSQLQAAIQSSRSDAFDIQVVNLPTQGTLLAAVSRDTSQGGDISQGLADTLPLGTVARQLTLIYRVPGIQVTWKEKSSTAPYWAATPETLPATGGEVVWGPSYTLSFDGELEIDIAIPDDPTFPIGAFVPQLTRWVTHPNAIWVPDKHDWMGPQGVYTSFWARNVKPTLNFWGDLDNLPSEVSDWWNSRPNNSDHLPDQEFPVSILDVFGKYDANGDNLLSLLFKGFLPLVQQGFVQLKPSIENNAVVLRLYHPNVDHGPGVKIDGHYGAPTTILPSITSDRTQTKAGSNLGVNGQNFPPTHAHQFRIDWIDTTSSVTQSDIEFVKVSGPNGNQIETPHTTTLQRHKGDQATFLASNLMPNQWFRFRVKDSARFSFPPWGDPLYVKTDPSDEVTLFLDNRVKKQMVGHAHLGTDGTFSTSITVPKNVPAGKHVLWAEAPGSKVASTTIIVIGANQKPQPMLQVLDPSTQMPLQTPKLLENTWASLRGEGFVNGTLTFYLDSPTGQKIGNTNAGQDGTFTTSVLWPSGVYGIHKIVAVQVLINGQKFQAEASVYGQAIPH